MSVMRETKKKGKSISKMKKKQSGSKNTSAGNPGTKKVMTKAKCVVETGEKAKKPMKSDIKSNIEFDTGSTLQLSAKDKHSKLISRKKFKNTKGLKDEKNKLTGVKEQIVKPGGEKIAKLVGSPLTIAEKRKNKKLKRKLKKEMEKKGSLNLNDSHTTSSNASPKKVENKDEVIRHDTQKVMSNKLKQNINASPPGKGSPKKHDSKESKNSADMPSTHTVVSEKKKLKRLLWKQKQMAKKLERKGLVNKQENKYKKTADKVVLPTNVDTAKVFLPKTAEGATENWKKLQETMSSQNQESKKRKIPEHRLRNPKYRKVEDSLEKNAENDLGEEGKPDIWFDDVDEMLLDRKAVSIKQVGEETENGEVTTDNPLIKAGAFKGVTKIVCMDCEMVGVGDGTESMLARVSIVNQYGEPIYDRFVKPKEEIVDYRTYVSGVRPEDLENAEEFEEVQKTVADILKGRMLVGHAIKNDLKVLYLSHPRKRIRDTSSYKPFRQLSGGKTPSLKKLSEKVLAVKVQEGEHNSVQDAQATMRLYTMHRKQWESDIIKSKKEKRGKKKK